MDYVKIIIVIFIMTFIVNLILDKFGAIDFNGKQTILDTIMFGTMANVLAFGTYIVICLFKSAP